MKTLLVMIAALSFSSAFSSAFAKDIVSTITCNVKEEINKQNIDVKVEFMIKNLGSKNAQLLQHPKKNDDMGSILITPLELDGSYTTMAVLNDQGGDLRVGKDRIRLFGDGDGYTFVDLVLFKDSGYETGYVRVSGSADKWYQSITCTVK